LSLVRWRLRRLRVAIAEWLAHCLYNDVSSEPMHEYKKAGTKKEAAQNRKVGGGFESTAVPTKKSFVGKVITASMQANDSG